MKVLNSSILPFVTFVTLSSVHVALGLKCYECKAEVNTTDIDPNPGSLLRQSTEPKMTCPDVGVTLNDTFVKECESSQKYCAHMVFKSNSTGMAELAVRTCYDPSDFKIYFKRNGKCVLLGKSSWIVCPCEGELCNIGTGVDGYPVQQEDNEDQDDNDRENHVSDKGSGSKGIRNDLLSLWPAVLILWVISSLGLGPNYF